MLGQPHGNSPNEPIRDATRWKYRNMPYFSPKGRLGRVMRAIHRCLELADGRPVPTTAILSWSHERQIKYLGQSPRNARSAVRIACERLCDRAGRATTRGRPILWVLKHPQREPGE